MEHGQVTLKKTWLIALLISMTAASTGAVAAESPVLIPHDRLLTDTELVNLLDAKANPEARQIQRLYREQPTESLKKLAEYFREAFSERYFFDWKNMAHRFTEYRERFPDEHGSHAQNRDIHMALYPARAQWKLPYENLKGDPVTAYELRHLARQHKMLDMAFMHHYEGANPVYIDYFVQQMRSLNEAFAAGEYEDDAGGNGVYESFRAGYRVLNWLQVHAFYLGSERYQSQDQLELIRTMLHLGASLHTRNPSFRYGNHQTRGMVALAMIAILLKDYTGTDVWYKNAIAILGEHLEKEVNPDGFQFERSIHYHVGDIYNYFRVLQLAQLNGFTVPEAWQEKLKTMFDAAVILARPDRRLPVFQDDTNTPWAENNEMDDFMMLGAVLFDDPVINYFASDSAAPAVYWLLRDEQIQALSSLDRALPEISSAELPDTGYYIMREGWKEGGLYMAITAGLSEYKPDHQHGDMLGLVARANRQEILPNYQVRYSLPDYEYFKNSFVKNVALVDNIPHGLGWQANRGGSGFGKWEKLPQPQVITWIKRADWDFFTGSHDAYDDIGVKYYRKILFAKGLGWVVRDIFDSSSGGHEFQQVWQGHYSDEGTGNRHRSTFADGSGLEILQLGGKAESASTTVRRGKGNLVYTMSGEAGEYTTLLYPFNSFENRMPDSFFDEGRLSANGWTIRTGLEGETVTCGFLTDAQLILEHADGVFLLAASWIANAKQRLELSGSSDLYLEYNSAGLPTVVTFLGHRPVGVKSSGQGQVENAWFQPGSSMVLP